MIRCVYKLNVVGTTYTLWVQNKYTLFTISTFIARSQLTGGHAVMEKKGNQYLPSIPPNTSPSLVMPNGDHRDRFLERFSF